MDNMKLIIDFYKNLENLGPGSKQITKQALNIAGIDKLKKIKVADIGCGTGASSLFLAQELNADITSVDFLKDFLDELNIRSKDLNSNSTISTLECSMDELPFEDESLDMIWSEGAIYNIGFENGINSWKQFLKTGGILAASEITWLTDERPDEINDYWNTNYPEIATEEVKINQLKKAGYKVLGYFVLPKSCWLEEYYAPMEKTFDDFLSRNNNSEEAKAIVEESKIEIELYKKYSDYYSYGFYIAQKI